MYSHFSHLWSLDWPKTNIKCHFILAACQKEDYNLGTVTRNIMRNYRDWGLSDTYLETGYGLSYKILLRMHSNQMSTRHQNHVMDIKRPVIFTKCLILGMHTGLLILWYFCYILNIIFISNPTDISHIIELAFTTTTTASFMLSIGNFTSYFDKFTGWYFSKWMTWRHGQASEVVIKLDMTYYEA